MKRSAAVALAVAPFVLASCAGEPAPPARRAPEAAAAVGSGSAPVSAAPTEPVRELTLEQALRLADASHPYLALAQAELEASAGRVVQAGLFPSTAAIFRMESGRLNHGNTLGDSEYLAGALQVLPVSGRLGASERIERRDRERLEREADARRLEVHARIRGAFASALFFELVKRAHLAAATHADRAVEVARARVKSGDAPPDDEARAEIEATKARIDADRAGSESEQAIFDLVAAIGAPELRVASLAGELDQAFEVPGIERLARRLEEHPALLAAIAKESVEDARIELAERLKVPDMYVELYYRRLEHSNANAIDAGFGFLLPFFDRSQGRIVEARAQRAAARAQVLSTRLELEAQLRSAHSKLARALRAARALRDVVLPRTAVVLEAAEARYAKGDASLADVLPVRRERVSAEIAYLDALRGALEAWGALLPFLAP